MMRKWIPFGLLMVGVLLYWNSLSNAFVFDDEEQILGNTVIQSLYNIPEIFTQSTMNSGGAAKLGGVYYKPVMTSAYAVLWAMAGPEPFVFHLFQLIVHLLNSVLVFYFLGRFFRPITATLLSLVFLVHPLNTECVVYSADLQDVLFLFFGMLSLLLCGKREKLGRWGMLGLGVTLLLSILSKESGLLFMVAVCVYLALYQRNNLRKGVLTVLTVFGLYAFLRFGVAGLGEGHQNVVQIARASLPVRLLTIPAIIGFYLKTFFYPAILSTTQDWVVTEASLSQFWLPFLALVIVFGGALYYVLKKWDRSFSFFLFWLVIGLGLHLNLVPLDGTVADRWFYFPMIGLLGLLGLLGEWAIRNKAIRVASIAAGVMVISGLAARSYARTLNWKDGFTLYAHDIKDRPDAYDLNNNLGVELFRHGRIAEAKRYFEKSTQLAPHWFTNWNNLGAAYEAEGDLDRAEACYLRSLNQSAYYIAYENYFKILMKKGRVEEARAFVQNQALKVFPNNALFQSFVQ